MVATVALAAGTLVLAEVAALVVACTSAVAEAVPTAVAAEAKPAAYTDNLRDIAAVVQAVDTALEVVDTEEIGRKTVAPGLEAGRVVAGTAAAVASGTETAESAVAVAVVDTAAARMRKIAVA